jgi:hypothetical protein
LIANQGLIKAKFSEALRYTPVFLDNYIVEKFLDGICAVLNEVADNPSHELRRQFDEAVRELIEPLQTSAEYCESGKTLMREFVEHLSSATPTAPPTSVPLMRMNCRSLPISRPTLPETSAASQLLNDVRDQALDLVPMAQGHFLDGFQPPCIQLLLQRRLGEQPLAKCNQGTCDVISDQRVAACHIGLHPQPDFSPKFADSSLRFS